MQGTHTIFKFLEIEWTLGAFYYRYVQDTFSVDVMNDDVDEFRLMLLVKIF